MEKKGGVEDRRDEGKSVQQREDGSQRGEWHKIKRRTLLGREEENREDW